MASKVAPLIVVVGPTASGKSDVGMMLAQRFNGEIIAADSRTVYQHMNIGTAKPTMADQAHVKHHLLDMVEPGENYNAAHFKYDAQKAIDDITSRGKIPIMVGGSGLYVDSILFDYNFQEPNPAKRQQLNKLSMDELKGEAEKLGIVEGDVDFSNRRHLQRAVEAGGVMKQQKKLRPNTLVIGITRDKAVLEQRINARIDAMIEQGFVHEVENLLKTYGKDNEAMTGIGYRPFAQYLNKELSLESAKRQFVRGDMLLAKRQMTWFKRNKSIHWENDRSKIVDLTTTFLSNFI